MWDEVLLRTTVYNWFKRFKKGRESLDDDKCSGRPISSRVNESVKKNSRTDKKRPLSIHRTKWKCHRHQKIRSLSHIKWIFETTEGLCAIWYTRFEPKACTSASSFGIFLVKVFNHPTYSLYLSPCNILFFKFIIEIRYDFGDPEGFDRDIEDNQKERVSPLFNKAV